MAEPVAVAGAREPGPGPCSRSAGHGGVTSRWFGSTAGRVGRLLDRSAALTPTESAASIVQLQAEWTSLPPIRAGHSEASAGEAGAAKAPPTRGASGPRQGDGPRRAERRQPLGAGG